MMDAYDYTRDNGILLEGDYPYKYSARTYPCDKVEDKPVFKNTGAIEEDEIDNHRLKELVAIQPVGVAMHSNQSCLMSYRHGIVTDSDCHCSNPERNYVNHAVVIVGYGKSSEY